jgi:ribosomal protein S18 acetylase RimI-like enzyme
MSAKTQFTIRPMKERDFPLIRSGVCETNWQDIPEDQRTLLKREQCDQRAMDDFDRWSKDERFKFAVFVAAGGDDQPIGFISVGEMMNPCVGLPMGGILDFWVSPEFRRQGIGGALFDFAMNRIRSMGYSHGTMMVSARNEAAVSLYGKKGFKVDRMFMAKAVK